MSRNTKKIISISLVDFLMVFILYMIARGLHTGRVDEWYWMATMAIIWALIGAFTHKLEFWHYSNKKRALFTIIITDSIVCALNHIFLWIVYPAHLNYVVLWLFLIIVICECILYLLWNVVYRQAPYMDEDRIYTPIQERGMEKAVPYQKNEKKNDDLSFVYDSTTGLKRSEYCHWILNNRAGLSPNTLIVVRGDIELLQACTTHPNLIICLQSINDIKDIDGFLTEANALLSDGGTIAMYGQTSGMRRAHILSTFPAVIGHVAAAFDYFGSRVLAKLHFSRGFIEFVSGGKNRNLPRVEILGRIAKAGFEIRGEDIQSDVYRVAAVRTKEPNTDKRYYGMFIRLPREGKDGDKIGVFKLRTMYAYSEYIQDYTYKLNGLADGGKLRDDFRINLIGSFCRSTFLDEIPMMLNFLRGDLKFVGVRPLSSHYLSLYSPEMQKMHLSVKPGLFPPLYYDYPKPSTIEDIQESERRYIERYRRHPFHTDWVYFWGMARNIIFRRERSH